MPLDRILDHLIGVSPVSLVIAFATLFITIVYYSLKTRGLPPGPTGLPLLGYWPFINHREVHIQFDDFKKKYGDVFSINITGRLFINLGSVKAVREAHVSKSDCFAKRNEDFNMMTDMFGNGVVSINSEEWKVNRKFFQQAMKERGLLSVQHSMSGSLYESLNSVIDDLRAKKSETVNVIEFLSGKCNNTLRLTLFGESGVSEELLQKIYKYYGSLISFLTAANFLPTGNIARYIIFPLASGYREYVTNLRKVQTILYKIIDDHKSTYDEEHIRDIIDEYIKERSVRSSKGDATAKYFTDKALMSTLVQLVGDGSQSVAIFISLFIKALIDHPEEQDKIYKELVDVVGLDRQPTIEDKSHLTYTNAFLLEVLRTSNVIPFFPSLECTKETTLRGYRIPKGSITLMNIYSAHFDPESYEEPEKFNPSRYIATEGKRRPDLPITFGVGKRSCIGEGFTMMQVLLFVTTIIKNFHVLPPDDTNDSLNELLTERALRIVVQPRSQK